MPSMEPTHRPLSWPLYGSLALAGLICIMLMTLAGRARSEDTPPPPAAPANQTTMTNPPAPGTYRQLTPEETAVIVNQGTEAPFTGEYDKFFGEGVYTCKRCGAMLYRSEDKFDAHCGWPAFDDALPGAVKRVPDPDGQRTEIECANCGAHLGHVFTGEHLTSKDTRYCVNSISMLFLPKEQVKYGRAIFAGGCFWGVQYYFSQVPGVLKTTAGYTGGHVDHPTYEQVCGHQTGHAEAVEVLYDPVRVSYETLAQLFFEIHDPTQVGGQGPDLGSNYRSAIFYTSDDQKQVAAKLIADLTARGMKIATEVTAATTFWPAEDYHQNWYEKKGGSAPCHVRTKLW